MALNSVDVLVAAYKPNLHDLNKLLLQLQKARDRFLDLKVHIIHNDGLLYTDDIQDLYSRFIEYDLPIRTLNSTENIGFGAGINKLAIDCHSPYFFIINQDAIPEPGSLDYLFSFAFDSACDVGAWEMRQIPYEHPKIYNPQSLETPWVSGAAFLVRAAAFTQSRGFEKRIFMYGEDVDLSWKMRAKGWKLLYVPRSAVHHQTYENASKVKPLQLFGAIYSGLCIRARYSGRKNVVEALMMALYELLPGRQSFKGRRKIIVKAILKFARNYFYFRSTAIYSSESFHPFYNGWSYEERRLGDFFRFKPISEKYNGFPLISIMIRTCGRPGLLREALKSAVNQTWPNIEIIVVEDGPGNAKSICDEFSHARQIKFYQNLPKSGRSSAGNLALSRSSGQWLCFLDDDDLLFADHCEALFETCDESNLLGAYGLSWRVFSNIQNSETPLYNEVWKDIVPYEKFSKSNMLSYNLFPIQAVLFNRSLYELNGGFDESMDQLEDWNLWTRYTMNNDFILLEKITSLYRVPANPSEFIDRSNKLDLAYEMAINKQNRVISDLSHKEFENILPQKNKSIVHLSPGYLRSFIRNKSYLKRPYMYARHFIGLLLSRIDKGSL